MTWLQTASGEAFRPLSPDPDTIRIDDIAHALAFLCRFNGHCRTFYSVAEHSVRVSLLVEPAFAAWGLMHDAAEAYVSDLPRPVKKELPAFGRMEDGLLKVIAKRFGLSWPLPQAVREADDRLLVTEARDLMEPPPESWGLEAEPLVERIEPWTPKEAEEKFLQRFSELFPAD